MLVVLDPGHGGYDSGAVNVANKLLEKDLNMELAFIMESVLEERFDVMLTRNLDSYVMNKDRVKLANKNNAKFYISLHHNGVINIQANGIEVLYYPHSAYGKQLAEKVVNRICAGWKIKNRGTKPGWYRQQPGKYLTVLRDTKMPAILIEACFLSNCQDREYVIDKDARRRFYTHIATSVMEVILNESCT